MLPVIAEIVWNEKTLAVALGCSIPLAGILGGCWYSLNKARSDNELKQAMVERGMSADEIERVLGATGEKEEAD